MATTPSVAPYESCIRCLRGDTTTGFAAVGQAESAADLPLDQAQATPVMYAEHDLGCELSVLACPACGRRSDVAEPEYRRSRPGPAYSADQRTG